MSAFAPDRAWDFILALYDAPGVAPACLGLQERHELDVTALLFCAWIATMREEPLGDRIQELLAEAREWHGSVILPVRRARRRAKAGASVLQATETEALYRGLLAAEVECEHAEFLLLVRRAEAQLGPFGGNEATFEATAARNLSDFLNASGAAPTSDDRAALEIVCFAAAAIAGKARSAECALSAGRLSVSADLKSGGL